MQENEAISDMNYLLVAGEAHVRPYVVRIDEQASEAAALATAAQMGEGKNFLQLSFLVNLDTGECKRFGRDDKGEWVLVDSAFDQNIGVMTPPEMFQQVSEENQE